MVFGGEQCSFCEEFECAQGEVVIGPDVATNDRLKKMA